MPSITAGGLNMAGLSLASVVNGFIGMVGQPGSAPLNRMMLRQGNHLRRGDVCRAFMVRAVIVAYVFPSAKVALGHRVTVKRRV